MRMVIVIKLVLMRTVHIIVNVYQDIFLMRTTWDTQVSETITLLEHLLGLLDVAFLNNCLLQNQ